jgi:hypothetical protein
VLQAALPIGNLLSALFRACHAAAALSRARRYAPPQTKPLASARCGHSFAMHVTVGRSESLGLHDEGRKIALFIYLRETCHRIKTALFQGVALKSSEFLDSAK